MILFSYNKNYNFLKYYTLFKRIQNERGWQQIRISKSEGISHKKKSYYYTVFTYFTCRLHFFNFQEMREPSAPANPIADTSMPLFLVSISTSFYFLVSTRFIEFQYYADNKEVKVKFATSLPFLWIRLGAHKIHNCIGEKLVIFCQLNKYKICCENSLFIQHCSIVCLRLFVFRLKYKSDILTFFFLILFQSSNFIFIYFNLLNFKFI